MVRVEHEASSEGNRRRTVRALARTVRTVTAPRVQALLVADAVYRDAATGKHIVAGTFTRLRASAFPCDFVRPVDVYVALAGLVGTCAVALRFALDDDILLRSTALPVAGRDPRDLVELVFPLPSLHLPRPGWYRLELTIDGAAVAALGLEARVASEPPDSAAENPFAIHLGAPGAGGAAQ